MNTFRILPAFVTVAALALVAPRASAETIYGITFFDNQLITINSSTGVGTLVGPLGDTVNGYGLGFRGSQLLTFDPNTDEIREINAATGALGSSFSIGVGDLIGEGDLTFRSDGIGFLSSALNPDFSPANDLFRFDLDAGTSTRLGTTDLVIDAMTFSGDTLYAIGQSGTPSLYIVDQDTGAFDLVGSLGLDVGSPFAGLTTTSSGTLLAALDDRLFTINTSTGMAFPVNDEVSYLGYNSVSGLAAAPGGANSVPDASASALLVLMGFATAVGGHRYLRRRGAAVIV